MSRTLQTGRQSLPGGQFLAATDAIKHAALEALLSGAEDIVLPAAVEKAPELLDVARAGTGHGPHADPAKYQGGEPGELKASAHIVDEIEERQRVGIAFDTPYAALQHERMDWHHDVGEAKYAENAVNETKDELMEHIADGVRKVTR